MTRFVQFEDGANTRIVGIYGNPQPDMDAHPHQGEVEDDDPRYLAYLESTKPVPIEDMDPVDKLKAFLAANPDVAAILS